MATPPSFTAGSVLTAAQMNAVGLWKITNGTVTNVGTGGTNVPNIFTSDYNKFQIVVQNHISSAAGVQCFMQLSVGGTQSATAYYAAGSYQLFAGGGGNINNNNVGQWFLNGPSNTIRTLAVFTFANPNVAVHTSFVAQQQTYDAMQYLGGIHQVATAYDGLRFFTNTGTTSFDYTVYGLR